MIRVISFIVIVILLQRCNFLPPACDFDITQEYIESSCPLYNGLKIAKLKDVKSFKNKVPTSYQFEFMATYGAQSMNSFDSIRASGLSIIHFKRGIDGYHWIWHKKGIVSRALPFDFEVGNWYLMSGLYENGAPSVLLYVYVKRDKSFEVFRVDKATNW